jgi:hypothetical protein
MVPRSKLTGRVSLEVGLTLNLRVVAVAAEGTVADPMSSAVGSIGGLTIDYNLGAASRHPADKLIHSARFKLTCQALSISLAPSYFTR